MIALISRTFLGKARDANARGVSLDQVPKCYRLYTERRSAAETAIEYLFFYHFNCFEPIYKSQRIKLLDIIAACNQSIKRECSKLDIANNLIDFKTFYSVDHCVVM